MEVWILLVGLTAVDAICTFVCFRRGEVVLGAVGVLGLLGLAPLLVWFPLYGALKRVEQEPVAVLVDRAVTEPADYSDLAVRSSISRFLEEARRSGAIDTPTFDHLSARVGSVPTAGDVDVDRTVDSGPRFDEGSRIGLPTWAASEGLPPTLRPGPVFMTDPSVREGTTAQTDRPPPPEPGELRQVWDRLWETWSSEIAIHGFAYVGVLMTFVAVLGFLLFAFVDVPDSQQPMYELGIAVIFFAWGWFLRRQNAVHVAAGMEFIGGMVLPLAAFASLVDNAPFPPDFEGRWLIVALTATSLLLALGYSRYTRRRPGSTLRYLVSPLVWLAAMVAGFWFKTDEILTSDAITRLVSPQPALAAVAVTATVALALRHREHRLAEPTVRASLVGIPVAYLLTVALAVGEDWEIIWPLALLGAATLVSAELVSIWFDRRDLLDVFRPVLLGISLLTIAPGVDLAWLGLATAATYVALFEYSSSRSQGTTHGALLTGAGVVIGGLMALGSPLPALITSAGLTLWAHLRRRQRWQRDIFGDAFSALAAAAPVAGGAALMELLPDGIAMLTMAGMLVVSTATVRLTRSADLFWPVWLTGASGLLAVVAYMSWSTEAVGIEAPIVVVLTALSVAAAPRWPAPRLWGASAMTAAALGMLMATLNVAGLQQALVWAAVGLGLIGSATWLRRGLAAHLAAVGHLVGLVAFGSVGPGDVGLALAWSAWAGGWVLTTVAGELGGETLHDLLARLIERLGEIESSRMVTGVNWLSPVMAVATVPVAVIAWGDVIPVPEGWSGVSVSLVAVVYALATRVWTTRRPLARALSLGGMIGSIGGLLISAPETWPTIVGCVSVVMVAGIVAPGLRQHWFSWAAWAVSVPLVVRLGEVGGVPIFSLDVMVFLWGAVLMTVGLAVDDAVAGRRQPEQGVRTSWLLPPVVVGFAAFVVGLTPVLAGPAGAADWWSLVAAGVSFVVAYEMRIAPMSGIGYGLSAFAAIRILAVPLADEPWQLVVMAAVLVVVSWALQRSQPPTRSHWSSWDLPPLVVASFLGVVALVLSVPASVGETWLAAGLLCATVSVWKRDRVWAETGNLLLLVAALDFSLGWFALALAATSLRGMAGVWLSRAARRLSYQVIAIVGAALAWPTLLAWLEVDPPTAVGLTAVVFGAVALGAAVGSRWFESDTVVGWWSLGVLGLLIDLVVGAIHREWIVGPFLALGLLLLAVAFHVGARATSQRVGAAAAPTAGLAWVALIPGLDWPQSDAVGWTGVVFGLLAIVVAGVSTLLSRDRHSPDETTVFVARVWMSVAVAGVVFAFVANLAVTQELIAALGLALAAVGLIGGARPLELPWMRSVAMGAGLIALNLVAADAGLEREEFALGVVVLAAFSALVSTSVWRRQESSVWVTPLLVLATLANLETAAVGIAVLPDRSLLVAVLISVGLQTRVVGLIRDLPGVLAVAPIAVGLGFVLMVDAGLAGSAQWYTAPLGVVLLSEVEVLRSWRRRSGSTVPDVQVLEWVAVGVLVVPGIVEMFTTRLIYGLVPFLLAGLLLVWATMTRVRRRAVGAAAVAIATSVLVLFAAAADRSPDTASFWIVGFGAGLAVMLVAAFVEAYRTRRGRTMLRLHELMEGWE